MTYEEFEKKRKLLKISDRESIVAWGIISGLSYKQMSHMHKIPLGTIKSWSQKIFRRMRIRKRELLIRAIYLA